MIFIQCIIIIFIFNFFKNQNARWATMILTVLKPAAVRSMENSVRVNSTATTDCVILNWVVRNKMVCFVRISVCNYLKLCKVLICNHFHFFFFLRHCQILTANITWNISPKHNDKTGCNKVSKRFIFSPSLAQLNALHGCCICCFLCAILIDLFLQTLYTKLLKTMIGKKFNFLIDKNCTKCFVITFILEGRICVSNKRILNQSPMYIKRKMTIMRSQMINIYPAFHHRKKMIDCHL